MLKIWWKTRNAVIILILCKKKTVNSTYGNLHIPEIQFISDAQHLLRLILLPCFKNLTLTSVSLIRVRKVTTVPIQTARTCVNLFLCVSKYYIPTTLNSVILVPYIKLYVCFVIDMMLRSHAIVSFVHTIHLCTYN